MVSFAAMKRLPDDSKKLLEAALPKIKLASRVAARYLASTVGAVCMNGLAQRGGGSLPACLHDTELPAAFPKNENRVDDQRKSSSTISRTPRGSTTRPGPTTST